MTERRFIEEACGEEYTHKIVWLVVKRQVAHAKANPKDADSQPNALQRPAWCPAGQMCFTVLGALGTGGVGPPWAGGCQEGCNGQRLARPASQEAPPWRDFPGPCS